MAREDLILTLNGGSSSLKFALFAAESPPRRILRGGCDRLGGSTAALRVVDVATGEATEAPISAADLGACAEPIADELEKRGYAEKLAAVAHRIVHGGPKYRAPTAVTVTVLAELRSLSPFDPDHLPGEIALLEAIARRFPSLPQLACFDTGFHRDLPRVAALLPIPRRYEALGIRRYGFHGLSYAYLMRALEKRAGASAARGRVVLAHLGSGASMAAVKGGVCIDTTMAFTPTAGLVMGTRSGDLDPGLVAFLAEREGLTVAGFHEMVNRRSGLLGVSETSADVRELLAREREDPRAAEALALFCYQARKWIGALAAALGGLDTLVFSGGIGERSAVLRSRICEGLAFLGIELAAARNERGEELVSCDRSRVAVRVLATDEEAILAEAALAHVAADA